MTCCPLCSYFSEVLYHNHVVSASDDDLNKLMDEKVKPALGVIPDAVHHQTSSSAVFNALGTDFMKPVTSVGEWLGCRGTARVLLVRS